MLSKMINRQIVRNYSAHGTPWAPKIDEKPAKMWKNLFFFVAIPSIILGHVNVYLNEEHEERPEFIKYDHLRVKTKPFPWGNGNRGFFFNPRVNAEPDGYVDE